MTDVTEPPPQQMRETQPQGEYAQSMSILRLRDEGQAVRDLQNALAALGYLDSDEVDGIFGPHTKAAVEQFQDDHRLIVDGIVGDKTRKAISKRLAKRG